MSLWYFFYFWIFFLCVCDAIYQFSCAVGPFHFYLKYSLVQCPNVFLTKLDEVAMGIFVVNICQLLTPAPQIAGKVKICTHRAVGESFLKQEITSCWLNEEPIVINVQFSGKKPPTRLSCRFLSIVILSG